MHISLQEPQASKQEPLWRCATHPVRGKVDGAFLGPFEGLWHVLHVIESKFHMVIGH